MREENRVNVVRAGWLSKHIGKPYRLVVVVYFKAKGEAEAVLQKDSLDFGGKIAFT